MAIKTPFRWPTSVASPLAISKANQLTLAEEQAALATMLGFSRLGNVPQIPPATAKDAQSLVMSASTDRVSPSPVYDPSLYGDGINFPFVFGAAGDMLVLARAPAGLTRIYLLIVNTLAANPVQVAFGQAAALLSGIPIPAAGNYEPLKPQQNDVHVFSPVAGTIQIVHTLVDLSTALN